jgi:hypothetical protein
MVTASATLGHQPGPGAGAYTLSADVILVPVQDGTARLLDLGGSFYAVSEVGAVLLREVLEEGTTAAEARVSEQFGVSLEQVRTDLADFLIDLERKRLIRRGSQHRSAGHSLARWSSSAFCLPLRGIHRECLSLNVRAWLVLTLAYLSCRLFGWAATIAAWQRVHARAVTPGTNKGTEPLVSAMDEAVRRAAARHILPMACKERSLCCWSLLRAYGVAATLKVGIELFPLEGHCWCECGGWLPADDPDYCQRFTPVAQYE